MKACQWLMGLALLSFLVACKEVKIENGEIPSEYLSIAEKFVGEYPGRFENNRGTLSVSLAGQKLILKFSNGEGDDLLGQGCRSEIGDLTTLYVGGSEAKPRLDSAFFAFDAGACADQVEGTALRVRTTYNDERIRLDLEVLEGSQWVQRCRPGHTDPIYGGGGTDCTWEREERYLYGRFQKSSGN